jgi:hypothetical protein
VAARPRIPTRVWSRPLTLFQADSTEHKLTVPNTPAPKYTQVPCEFRIDFGQQTIEVFISGDGQLLDGQDDHDALRTWEAETLKLIEAEGEVVAYHPCGPFRPALWKAVDHAPEV